MSPVAPIRLELIDPKKEFGSYEIFLKLLGPAATPENKPLFLDLPGIAVILDGDLPMWEPTLYLLEKAVTGRSLTGDTARTYGESLLPWLRFLRKRGESIFTATEEILGTYRAGLAFKEELASSTINLRVVVPILFHRWGQANKSVSCPLGAYLVDHKTRRGVFPTYSEIPIRRFTPRVIRRLPRLVDRKQWAAILANASAPYGLIFKWAIVTGLRRFEICALKVSTLHSLNISPKEDELIQLNVLRKGSVDASVYVPQKLIDDTLWWLITQRPDAKAGAEDFAFISREGNPVSRDQTTREFRRCADLAGSDATLHHLRHTFAATVLAFLQRQDRQGNPLNPLKATQILMGHASSSTTEIYLRGQAATGPAVLQALDYLYGGSL